MYENKTILNDVEKKLVAEFVTNATEIKKLEASQKDIMAKLIEQAPHKRGDVVKWTETGRRKNIGTIWNPKYVDVADSERKAVVYRVRPSINVWNGEFRGFSYDYEFVVLKKDGSVGVNSVYVHGNYEWTGEHVNME